MKKFIRFLTVSFALFSILIGSQCLAAAEGDAPEGYCMKLCGNTLSPDREDILRLCTDLRANFSLKKDILKELEGFESETKKQRLSEIYGNVMQNDGIDLVTEEELQDFIKVLLVDGSSENCAAVKFFLDAPKYLSKS
jgi:hypothetical protein